jgi:hypothetical protein
MNAAESNMLRLEPLTVAHAGEMFETLSAQSIYDYISGGPPSSAAALRERWRCSSGEGLPMMAKYG